MPVARGLCSNYPATGEQAAGLILIILKYIEIIACIPAKGERYKQNKPRRRHSLSGLSLEDVSSSRGR